MSKSEPKEFSCAVENLITGLRELPEDWGRARKRKTTEPGALVDGLLVKYRISQNYGQETGSGGRGYQQIRRFG